MSLLRDIQNELASAGGDTATVLRKCKILATRLKSDQFAEWVECELNGYSETQPLAEYRRLTVIYYASFANSAYQYPRSPIPLRIIPEEYRESFTFIEFRDGIAKAESLAQSKSNITIPKPDLVPAIQTQTKNMYCQQVWAEIPTNEFHQLLSAVKNRILDFALKLEAENPDAGEAPANTAPISPEKLRPLVQNIFYSSSIGAIAQNSEQFSQTINMQALPQDVAKLAADFAAHLNELNLTEREKQRVMAQLAILKTESTSDLDLGIVKQAATTLRSITEGAIGSLLATAAQPTVWHWIQQMLGHLSK